MTVLAAPGSQVLALVLHQMVRVRPPLMSAAPGSQARWMVIWPSTSAVPGSQALRPGAALLAPAVPGSQAREGGHPRGNGGIGRLAAAPGSRSAPIPPPHRTSTPATTTTKRNQIGRGLGLPIVRSIRSPIVIMSAFPLLLPLLLKP